MTCASLLIMLMHENQKNLGPYSELNFIQSSGGGGLYGRFPPRFSSITLRAFELNLLNLETFPEI